MIVVFALSVLFSSSGLDLASCAVGDLALSIVVLACSPVAVRSPGSGGGAADPGVVAAPTTRAEAAQMVKIRSCPRRCIDISLLRVTSEYALRTRANYPEVPE